MPFINAVTKNSIATVTINRPEVLNVLNEEVFRELLAFLQITAIQNKLKAVILTGAGQKAFIAGADIKAMENMDFNQMLQFCKLGQEVAEALETSPFVTIAAVNGYALGGGLEMALACDFIYASTQAKLGLPETKLGLIPGFGGTQRLTSAIGMRRAKELIYSGAVISAQEAKEIGLVNRVCEPDDLLSDCESAAAKILQNSITAIIKAKQSINNVERLERSSAYEQERISCARCLETKESKSARTTFINK